jgi:PAS domain S-box-containing protein
VGANQAAAVLQQQSAEAALRESEDRYRSVIAAMQEGVALLGADGRIRACNTSAERILGLSAEQITGRTTLDPRWQAIHEDGSVFPGEMHPVMQTLRTGQPCSNVVMGVRKPTGELTWISINSQALRHGDEPPPYAVVASFSDITERKRTEEALRESERRWRNLTEALPQLVWTATPDGACDYFSTQWTQHTGVPDSNLLGWRWLEVLHPDDREPTRKSWTDSVAGRGPYDVEYRVRRSDGEYRWFKTRGVPIRDGEGAIFKWFGTCTDITTSKQLEEALRQANERLDLAVRASNLAIWEVEMTDGNLENGRVTVINGWEPLGYNASETPSNFAGVFALQIHPDDQARVGRAVQAYLEAETGEFEAEFRAPHKDGSQRWHLSRGTALRDAEGRPMRFLGSTVDITDLKRAEEALRESEQRFRTFVDHATDAFFLLDDKNTILDVNLQACQSLGYARDELVGMTPTDLDTDVAHGDVEDIERRLNAGETIAVESRHRRKDGTIFPVEIRGRAFWEGGRRLTVALARDITERKRAEEALRESERRFRTLAEALPHMVWTAEPDGAHDYFNAHNFEYTGLTPEQLRGWDWRATIYPADLPRCLELWTHSIATGEPYEIEYRLRRADGAFRWHLARALALRDDAGRITKWFGSCIDIDDQKRAQEALRRAKEAAEAANRAKDEFLANVSHEIRTPMNAILGMTDLVLDTPLADDQRQSLKTVKSAADNLLGIINDLLDFSKIEAGKLELDLGDFSLRSVVGDTLRALAVRAHRKGLEVVCNVQLGVPDALIGDAGRLRQVLLNLVGNAIKFTESGEVVVQVGVDAAAEPSAGPETHLRFIVRDTGPGIPHHKQATIFRAFEQEDASTTRKHGGTGLGLTIAAQLVALMGGEITVDSAPGQGSTFAFSARFELQPQPASVVAWSGDPTTTGGPPILLRNLPVLVVDDNATNRHILEEWLRNWQIDAHAVADAAAAMDALWHRAANGRPYALVLLDARMPDRDGLTLASMIRERTELSAARLILLTSGDRPGDQVRFRELRIDAHLLKPVQQEELLETIYRVMSRPAGNGPTTVRPAPARELPTTPAPPEPPLHILVAEDNEFSARLMDQLLVRRGHRVRLATNGREALALAEEGAFDLLLLDIHMPEMDGFGIIGAIRERERTAGGHLPVIALTARSRKEDRERCLAAGMDDFLTKPVATGALFAAIERLVFAHRIPRPYRAEGVDQRSLLDPAAVLRACGDDAELLRIMCHDFHAHAPTRLAEVVLALRDRDAPRLQNAVHKLCALLFAFSTVAGNVASSLEDRATQGQLEEAQSLAEQLETMTQELMQQSHGLSLEVLRQQANASLGRHPPGQPIR